MRERITPLIITYNEAPNIRRTLGALSWANQVVMIDSFSDDETLDLARSAHPNVVIVPRAFDSFAGQCNFGLTQITTEWVLSIDADYVLTPGLIEELRTLEPSANVAGYSAKFRYCIFGHRLRSTIYPPRTVLYRRDCAHYENEGHGHKVRVNGAVQPLQGKIEHDDRKPLSRWIRSQDRYLTIEARHLISTPNDLLNRQDRLRKKIYFAPAIIFFYLLFGRGLILDGWPGWYYVFQRTIAEILLSLRLITEREGLEKPATEAENPLARSARFPPDAS
jgi:glycosyltransferase involved in cell wall biosynthesis